MNLMIQAVFNVPDESNPQEYLQKIGEFLNLQINEENGIGEEVRLYGLELTAAMGDDLGKKVFLYNSREIDEGVSESINDKDNQVSAIHIIRVSIEGVESHKQRFEIMDRVIEEIGGDPDEERLNVYFVFDSGTAENFGRWAVPLILQPNPELIRKAKEEGITFCQWLSRKDRDELLSEVERQIRVSRGEESETI